MRISSSLVSLFKSCRRAYWLKYVGGLTPRESAQALIDGSNYHECVEKLYRGEEYSPADTKISAMVEAYKKYILPHAPAVEVEKWFEYPLTEKHTLVGRFDGIAYDGRVIEHKTTSEDIDEEYKANLQWNEQILTYMLVSGKNRMLYTACKKPLLRQKKEETEEEYRLRVIDWYDVETSRKIATIDIYRTWEEIENFRTELTRLADEIEKCDFFYRNPSWCTHFGRRCEYASICLNYDETVDYIEFERRGRYEP